MHRPLAPRLLCCRNMPAYLPSLASLQSTEDGPLATELRLVRLRSQAAVVRALADRVEDLSRAAEADGLGDQLIEEMARMGRRLLEAAEACGRARQLKDSGIFARCLAPGLE